MISLAAIAIQSESVDVWPSHFMDGKRLVLTIWTNERLLVQMPELDSNLTLGFDGRGFHDLFKGCKRRYGTINLSAA